MAALKNAKCYALRPLCDRFRVSRGSFRAVVVCAESEGEPSKAEAPKAEIAAPPPAEEKADPSSSGGLQPGQGTAIVTGAISLILGIAYIALTVLLDSRGELLPPPPEAFMQ